MKELKINELPFTHVPPGEHAGSPKQGEARDKVYARLSKSAPTLLSPGICTI